MLWTLQSLAEWCEFVYKNEVRGTELTYMHLIAAAPDYDSEKHLVPPGLEPGTFRVLSERDNHYTMELCFC